MGINQEHLYEGVNLFFDHIYVLTLPRATERHQKLENDLKGLNYTLFFGIDKKNMNLDDLKQQGIYDEVLTIKYQRYSRGMRIGEVVTSMGHKAIYEDMLKKGYKKILILEDDVVGNKEGLLTFNDAAKELPQNWDILYLDYNKNTNNTVGAFIKRQIYHLQKILGQLKWSHATINNLHAKKYSKHLKKSGYHDYASAYGITENAAKELIKLNTPICFPADHTLPFLITNRVLNGYVTIIKAFIQQSQLNKEVIGSYVEEDIA